MKLFTEHKNIKPNIFFTSDLHFNDERFDILYRPFKTIEEQNNLIIRNINKIVKEDDILYMLGDISVDNSGIKNLEKIKCKNKILIIGNYDEDKLSLLKPYFKEIYNDLIIKLKDDKKYYLNHYPVNKKNDMFNIVGHIHSLWKVKKNMVNVSTDIWNFSPVSEDKILFIRNAIENFYDDNVFIN